MKDFLHIFKLGIYVLALPLVATAAASAHQWMTDSAPVDIQNELVATTVSDGSVLGTLRNHTINMDKDGVVRGRLVSIEEKSREAVGLGGLKVYFARNGEVAQQVITGTDGTFEVEGIDVGAYSFIASGDSGFAAYGVNVVAGEAAIADMEVAAVSPKFSAVKEILETRVPQNVANEIVALAKDNIDTASEIGIQGSNRVQIKDGSLVGSVVPIFGQHQSVAGTYVHIVKNDESVAEVKVDGSGNFQIPDLAPGVYDFVAAGPTGFAAVSFEAVQDSEVIETAVPESASIPESVVESAPTFAETSVEPAQDYISTDYAAPASSLDVCLTCPQDNYIVSDTVDYACDSCGSGVVYDDYVAPPIEYAGEAVGCGCAAGAACGGCGSFGGFSNVGCCSGGAGGGLLGALGPGLQRAAQLGALALGIWAIGEAIEEIDDDDDTANDSPPQSPFQP